MNKEGILELERTIRLSTSWAEVAVRLGKSKGSGNYFKQLSELHNIDYSEFIKSHMETIDANKYDKAFSKKRPTERLFFRRAAIGVAIDWFLSNGFSPSLPVEVEKYDLVVESPQGFRKIQVKSSEKKESSGNNSVNLLTTTYNSDTRKYEQAPYKEGDIDEFFIVCSDGSKYLIPLKAALGKRHIVVTSKYKEFLV